MRLYTVLLASAVAVLASTASATDCDAGTYPPEASTDVPVTSVDSSASQAAPGIVKGYPGDSASTSSTGSNVDASAASTSGSNGVTQSSLSASGSSPSSSSGDVTQSSNTASGVQSSSGSYPDEDGNKWGKGDTDFPSFAASGVDASAATTSNTGDVTQGSYPDEDGNKWGKDDANLPGSNVDASAASTSNAGDVTQGSYPDEDGNKWGKDDANLPGSNADASAASTSNAGSYPDEDGNKWGKAEPDFPSSNGGDVAQTSPSASTSGSNDAVQFPTAAPTLPTSTDKEKNSGKDATPTPTTESSTAGSTEGSNDVIQYSTSAPTVPTSVDAEAASKPAADADNGASGFSTTDAPTTTTNAPVAMSASGSAAVGQTNSTTTAAPTTVPTNSTTASNTKLCAKPRVVVTEVDVGATVDGNEDEAALKVVAIAALPNGGSRIAFQSGDNVIIRELDSSDKLTSTAAVKVPLNDFADIYADENGFVILGTRDAEGGGTLNCGSPSNLCGTAPNPAVPCYDMYMVRYDGAKESWATKLTSSSASLPPYSSSATGPDVYMIWWYAHHGRLAFDGKNWAAYFGAAISTSEGGCINIHQGDRMKVVDASGSITSNADSFDWGCSHSAYERITYDSRSSKYAAICKTDNNNRIMPPNNWDATIYPVDLAASNLGDIVPDGSASSKKYWATVSNGDGDNAAVHLIHFGLDSAATDDIKLGGTDANERAPHLASIGSGGMLAMWEGSSAGGDLAEGGDRTIYAQVLDSTTGKAISEKVTVDKSVVGNRYQALKTYPDGSVAYLSKGKTDTSVQVVRFFGC